MTYQFYKKADAIIIAFDLTDAKSFQNTKTWLQSIYKHSQGSVIKTYCGNKLDLLTITQNYVQDEAAEKIANEHQMRYFKTSALSGEGIDEMIEYTIHQIFDNKIRPLLEQIKQSQVPVNASIILGQKPDQLCLRNNQAAGGCTAC